mmetsp:Transcript_40145/g.94373  ORF Transcript_40145/g.94373 Transcript_40145/m.94373 type:complete len:717 (-) Transcript_40145:3656-5806(-)
MKDMLKGYQLAENMILDLICTEVKCLSTIYARYLLLQIILQYPSGFSLHHFISPENSELSLAKRLYSLLEVCGSNKLGGWVGEAGAMALAAECLGLGLGHDTGAGYDSSYGSFSQLLNPSWFCKNPGMEIIQNTPASCAEIALNHGGGAALSFICDSLKNVCSESMTMCWVLTAGIRKSVRMIASVEPKVSNDSSSDMESSLFNPVTEDTSDIRLAAFLTGLLLSKPVQKKMGQDNWSLIASDLFEGWSVGLLSACMPFRMICAFTCAGLLNIVPSALGRCIERLPTLQKYFERLASSTARRMWAERAAMPVSSRYLESMVELMCSVRRSGFPLLKHICYDSATPLPLESPSEDDVDLDKCFVSSDEQWEVWTGIVEYHTIDWELPPKSGVRKEVDNGEGPPDLREGCYVLRGENWNSGDDDGKELLEKREEAKNNEEKELDFDKEKESVGKTKEDEQENTSTESKEASGVASPTEIDPTEEKSVPIPEETLVKSPRKKKKKIKPKLPYGTVLGITTWKEIPGLGRKVKWHATNIEKNYRYGGDGGCYDLVHVDLNEKKNKAKLYPHPESAEACAARHDFGVNKKFNILLRMVKEFRNNEKGERLHVGVVEWPDFGAGIKCEFCHLLDGSVILTEKTLLWGSKDSGWEARFGCPQFQSGTTIHLKGCNKNLTVEYSSLEELNGSYTFSPSQLRNYANANPVHVNFDMTILKRKKNK